MAREHEIKASEFLRPPGPKLWDLATGQEHVIIVGQKSARLVELHDELFLPGSGALLPAPSRRELPAAVTLLAVAARHAQDNSGQKVLVAGHTRQRGEASILLSEDRAALVFALLAGKRDLFGQRAVLMQRDDEGRDRRALLDWIAAELGWPCAVAGDDLRGATTRFQESYNSQGKAGNTAAADLELSGAFDSATWCAVHDCFRLLMARALEVELSALDGWSAGLTPARADKPFVGCGGYKPRAAMEPDLHRSRTDARAEVLFFDAGQEPEVPCFARACDPGACELFDARWYRTRRVDASARTDRTRLRLQLHDWLGDPCPDTGCKLTLASGQTLETTSDGAGWIEQQLSGGPQVLTATYTPTGGGRELSVRVETTGGSKTDAFYLAQLRHFGLESPSPRQSLYRLQQAAGLALTGRLDAATRERIDDIVDGDDHALKTGLGRDDG